jgi:hypothetical protein
VNLHLMSNCLSNELRVRQRFGQQELEHRIAEHVGVLAVVVTQSPFIRSLFFKSAQSACSREKAKRQSC